MQFTDVDARRERFSVCSEYAEEHRERAASREIVATCGVGWGVANVGASGLGLGLGWSPGVGVGWGMDASPDEPRMNINAVLY